MIDGTATVSADGLTATTDPGEGVTAPGWHGLTPPGSSMNTKVMDAPPPTPSPPPIPPETTFDAGLALNASFVPLKLSADFQIMTTNIPGFPKLDYNPSVEFPKNGFSYKYSSYLYTFTVPTSIANLIPTFNYSLFTVTAKLDLTGQATFQGTITVKKGSDEAVLSGKIVFSVKIEGSFQITDPFLSSLPFGVGNFLTKKYSFDVPLENPPAIDVPELDVMLPAASPAAYTATVSPTTSVTAESDLKTELDVFLKQDTSAPSLNAQTEAQTPSFSTAAAIGADSSVYYHYFFQNGSEITGKTGPGGQLNVFLPSDEDYSLFLYRPSTNHSEIVSGSTGASGSVVTSTILLSQLGGPDFNGDGIPDVGKVAMGLDPALPDATVNGLSYATNLENGLSPLGIQATFAGVAASLPLEGQAEALTLVGSELDSQGQTAYLATGSYGLAIVDASNFQKPTVLSQLSLPGNSVDVAVDPNLQIAAVASNSGGLNLVDVSDPTQPKLLNAIDVSATAVQVLDGIAYAAVGSELQSFDMLTGELLQTLTLGTSNITGLALDGAFLYTMDAGDSLRVIDLTSPLMVLRGSVTLPDGGGRLFVAGGVAYAVATQNFQGGYETIDVSNPDSPARIAASQVPAGSTLPASAIAPNGSGLGVLVGVPQRSSTGPIVDLMDLSDSTQTGSYLTQFNVPSPPLGLAIASGIAFVADGSSGLQVLNYEPFDTKGVPPTASISLASSPNVTVTTSGIQAVEGSNVTIDANVSDDVQVRNVELLVNGQVVLNDVSLPFDLSTTLPTIAQMGTTPVSIQLSATDTGGNTSLSNMLTVQLVPDTAPPVLLSSSIVSGIATRVLAFKSVTLEFSKPLDPTTVTSATIELIGSDGAVIPTNIQFRRNDATVVLTYPTLTVGSYQFVIHAASVTDVAGNALGATDVVSTFMVVTASAIWNNPAGGYWDVASNWLDDKVPGPTDDVQIDLPPGATVIYRGSQPTVRTLTNDGTIWIQGDNARGNAQLTVSDLLTNSGTIQLESINNSYSSGLSTSTGQIVNVGFGSIVVDNGSGGGRSISGTLVNQGQIIVDNATLLSISGAYQAAGGTITGPGYLVNCALTETASPALASTIVIAGLNDALDSDNLAGYTLWINGNSVFNSDAIVKLGANVNNRGMILLESSNGGYQSNIATGSYTLTNLGTLTSSLGSGGNRIISGTLANQGTVAGGNDYLEMTGAYQAQGGTTTGAAELLNCQLVETTSPASDSTIVIAGVNDTLESDNLAGYTLWVNGNSLFNSDAILKLGANVTNRGSILLESSNGGYQSNLATGLYTLTNLGTISSSLGSGGNRIISGTLANQGTVAGGNDYLEITGAYQAQGGTTTGAAELLNCQLVETASPASASTIVIAGVNDTLESDNLAGYALWINGNSLFNSDAILKLGANFNNRGMILLESSNGGYQSNIATGSYMLTNLGTISSSLGSGGNRIISGTLANQGTVAGGNDYLEITGAYQAQGGTTTGAAELLNCQLVETTSPASASTIVIAGVNDTLASDNLAGYTLWVNGNSLFNSDAILKLGTNFNNRGSILLESSNGGYQSNIATGSYTLTNLGTINSSLGSGGNRIISGTLNNQGTIAADADYLEIEGVYQAQGGTITGPGYLVNCTLQETASPVSPSTILISGTTTYLATDNLAGYTLWVNGNSRFNTDTILNLGGNVANRGTILLESSNGGYQSNIAGGSYILTNLGTITSSLGSGGNRIITGRLTNEGSIIVDAGTWLSTTGSGNIFNQNAGTINATGTFTVTGGLLDFNGGATVGDVGVYNGQLSVANTVTTVSSVGAFGGSTVLINNLSPSVTVRVQGRSSFGDAILNLSSAASNWGTILLESSDGGYQSNIATGSYTLTNLGTLSSSLGSGGNRIISGTLANQGTVAGGNDYLEITGAYQAQGGTTTGAAELLNCQLVETTSPASASTIVIAGVNDTLESDNLAGYTLWINGNSLFNSDAILKLGGNVNNRGSILLESSNGGYQSNIATGSYTLTNLGTISSSLGSGGNRIISGTLANEGTVAGDNDHLEITGTYQAQGGTTTGAAELLNCQLVETTSPASASTIVIAGVNDTLESDNLAGYSLWVNGNSLFNSDAILKLGGNVNNRGSILLESSNGGYQSNIATGSYTLTNLGTINSSLGSGGNRILSGTLANQGTVSVDSNASLTISGTYIAAGGAIAGAGYLVNCQIEVTASPASPTTILIGGQGDTLVTDNLPNTVLWVQGNNAYGDAKLTMAAGVTNQGTILMQSANSNYQSNLAAASGAVQNGAQGTINVGLGTGGARTIFGDLANSGVLEFSGASAGSLSVTGSYTQTSSGTLSIRLAGTSSTQYDRLLVTGSATLDGSLAVSLMNNFAPKTGDVYKFLTHASRVGSFAQVITPPGVPLRVVYNSTDTDLEL